jgi:hypothetical protein
MLVRFGLNPVEQTHDFVVEFRVMVKDDVSVGVRFGESFPQLLNNPSYPGNGIFEQ